MRRLAFFLTCNSPKTPGYPLSRALDAAVKEGRGVVISFKFDDAEDDSWVLPNISTKLTGSAYIIILFGLSA